MQPMPAAVTAWLETYDAAFNMVTPLSLPYVLDRYVPQLRAAADGDPATKVPA